MPIDLGNGNLLVSVQVNGSPATFILDTGAERTLMGENVVRQLGLDRDSWVASTVLGIGGYENRPNALPRALQLGGLTLRRHTLLEDHSVTVGPLPLAEIAGRQIAGLLGRDFLSPFDLDINVPARELTLYDVSGCTTGFLPWRSTYASVPATTPVGAALVIPVFIDGRPLHALIDTGASSSLVAAPGMARLGLTPALLERDPGGNGSGIGPAPVFMRRHRFETLNVGPDTTTSPQLWVSAIHVVPIVDMLLGADWLRTRRVWLSFTTKQIFIAMRAKG
ncbi:MAG TPA: retroviral-like aspartic protease family protein [Acetobacteraceae bacterium]|nr:retroviral-like aspartic protease family protein [Acetobacteraceae bacterium]